MQKNKLSRYCLCGIVLVVFVAILRGEWTIISLCDGFSLAGVLFLSYEGLRFLKAQRAFEGIYYIGARIKSLLFPFLDREEFDKKNESDYLKYQKRKQETTRLKDYSALIIGAGYLSLALLLLFFV